MRVWLDDQVDDPETPERHTPDGWVGVKTALQACRLLVRHQVTHIDLDHDLGDPKYGTGYLVARFIEHQAFLAFQPQRRTYQFTVDPLDWHIHSANPVGMERMRRALKSADRYWGR